MKATQSQLGPRITSISLAIANSWFALAACGDDDSPQPHEPRAGSSSTAGRGGGAGVSGAPVTAGQGGTGGALGSGGKGGSEASPGGADGNSGASGTAGAGGEAGDGGDSGLGGTSSAGAAGSDGTNCMVEVTPAMAPRSAKSAGFSASDTAYAALYDVVCTNVDACVSACTAAGGTSESCSAGSECPEASGSDRRCLPPTYWRNTDAITSPSDPSDAAVLTLVEIAYHDALVLSDFGLAIPEGATLRGIGFTWRRSSEAGLAVDESIRLVNGTGAIGANRTAPDPWSPTPADMSYGGESDLWGAELTLADVQSPEFGVSITPKYTDSAGNDRAYVSHVSAIAYYTRCD
jgi:hypothetical protein